MMALPTLRAASASVTRAPMGSRFNSTGAGSGADTSYGSATRSTVPPRSTHATYHPGGYGISEGLKRARKPYRFRNILTGSLIMGFATSVYFYSISKVRALRRGVCCTRMPSAFGMTLTIPTSLLTLSSCPSWCHRSSKTTFPTSPTSGLLAPRPTQHPHPSPPSRITSTRCRQSHLPYKGILRASAHLSRAWLRLAPSAHHANVFHFEALRR
jgi:cytochrome c oxidase assembly factor 3